MLSRAEHEKFANNLLQKTSKSTIYNIYFVNFTYLLNNQ